jgi:hypothetical protein
MPVARAALELTAGELSAEYTPLGGRTKRAALRPLRDLALGRAGARADRCDPAAEHPRRPQLDQPSPTSGCEAPNRGRIPAGVLTFDGQPDDEQGSSAPGAQHPEPSFPRRLPAVGSTETARGG